MQENTVFSTKVSEKTLRTCLEVSETQKTLEHL